MAPSASLDNPGTILRSSVYFLRRSEKFKVEKPYTFKFPGLCLDGPSTNVEFDLREIGLTDMRGQEKAFSIERNGFSIIDIENDLTYAEYHDEAGQSRYFAQIEDLLKEFLGNTVKVFRHGIRKRHTSFPLSTTGEPFENDQPTTLAHVDATIKELYREVQFQEGENAAGIFQKRFQWFNIWKPLKGPMNDWPLAVCDASTLDRSSDVEASDLLYPDHVAENGLVCYNEKQRWYYLSDHRTSEAIVFKQADSLLSSCPGVPHVSFSNPNTPATELPRESIEARALVYYDE